MRLKSHSHDWFQNTFPVNVCRLGLIAPMYASGWTGLMATNSENPSWLGQKNPRFRQ